jgi:hypothetical protein
VASRQGVTSKVATAETAAAGCHSKINAKMSAFLFTHPVFYYKAGGGRISDREAENTILPLPPGKTQPT